MKLSENSHQQLETFFREYFGDDKLRLPDVEVYGRGVAGAITKALKIYGITIGSRMFVRPDVLTRNLKDQLCISNELLAHELTHVVQYQKLGFFGFLYTYLKGYWKALKKKEKWDFNSRREAYLAIPHEVEARDCAAKYMEWKQKVNSGEL